MNRAQRRLLAKTNGDPRRAMQIAQSRALNGAGANESAALAEAMHEELVIDAVSGVLEEADHA